MFWARGRAGHEVIAVNVVAHEVIANNLAIPCSA